MNKDYYKGEEITVYWDQSKCIGAGVCYSMLRKVFNPSLRPWINVSGAETDMIIKTIRECPSGALSYVFNEELELQKSIRD